MPEWKISENGTACADLRDVQLDWFEASEWPEPMVSFLLPRIENGQIIRVVIDARGNDVLPDLLDMLVSNLESRLEKRGVPVELIRDEDSAPDQD